MELPRIFYVNRLNEIKRLPSAFADDSQEEKENVYAECEKLGVAGVMDFSDRMVGPNWVIGKMCRVLKVFREIKEGDIVAMPGPYNYPWGVKEFRIKFEEVLAVSKLDDTYLVETENYHN